MGAADRTLSGEVLHMTNGGFSLQTRDNRMAAKLRGRSGESVQDGHTNQVALRRLRFCLVVLSYGHIVNYSAFSGSRRMAQVQNIQL